MKTRHLTLLLREESLRFGYDLKEDAPALKKEESHFVPANKHFPAGALMVYLGL